MKKNIFKKCTSVLLALVMCLSTFVGIGSTTAYAAGEKGEVLVISFPRQGDSNYSASWGHDDLTYMNGWKRKSSVYTNIYAVNSYDGNICYCIEPGAPIYTGDNLVSKDENYWDNYPDDYNKTITPYEIKMFIGRIFQYGYTGTVSTNWKSQNASDADKLSEAIATQLLVWETVVGERDENFEKIDTGSYDAVLDSIKPDHPLRSKIMAHYNRIAESMQKHSKLPDFCSKTTGKAETVELEWNGTNYTATLTDANGVLGDYNFSANQSGISFKKDGNKLIITAEKAPSSEVTVTTEKTAQRKGIVVWGDGIYKPQSGVQDLATYTQTVNDPVKGFLKLKVSYGSAKIVKTSEDGKVDGISFRI